MTGGRRTRGDLEAGLAEYEQMEGIAWRRQSVCAAMFKASSPQEAVVRNPMDRKRWAEQATPAGGRPWRPVDLRIARYVRHRPSLVALRRSLS
jgi:hypothetical protein